MSFFNWIFNSDVTEALRLTSEVLTNFIYTQFKQQYMLHCPHSPIVILQFGLGKQKISLKNLLLIHRYSSSMRMTEQRKINCKLIFFPSLIYYFYKIVHIAWWVTLLQVSCSISVWYFHNMYIFIMYILVFLLQTTAILQLWYNQKPFFLILELLNAPALTLFFLQINSLDCTLYRLGDFLMCAVFLIYIFFCVFIYTISVVNTRFNKLSDNFKLINELA